MHESQTSISVPISAPISAKEQCIISQTQAWIETVVIQHHFCPFASRVFDAQQIHYQVQQDSEPESCLQALMHECQRLDKQPQIETSLLVLAQGYLLFDDYLDLLALAEQLIEQQGYEGIYQLASFHPQYCFADAEESDAANYTNRSPYPMFHLLRESSVELALAGFADSADIGDKIAQRNIDYAREVGGAALEQALQRCTEYQSKS